MLKRGIKISAIGGSHDEIKYQIFLTNGTNSTSLEFYGCENEFKNFGLNLISFPKSIDDTVIYELGEDNDLWAYYIRLKIYCFEPNGHSAIQVLIDNNEKSIHKMKSEFYIKTLPASLNKLGSILNNWNPNVEQKVEWTTTE